MNSTVEKEVFVPVLCPGSPRCLFTGSKTVRLCDPCVPVCPVCPVCVPAPPGVFLPVQRHRGEPGHTRTGSTPVRCLRCRFNMNHMLAVKRIGERAVRSLAAIIECACGLWAEATGVEFVLTSFVAVHGLGRANPTPVRDTRK